MIKCGWSGRRPRYYNTLYDWWASFDRSTFERPAIPAAQTHPKESHGAGGIVGALIAAIPGFIDLLGIQNPKSKSIGIWHMIINLLITISGWLGGELVYVRGVAVKQPPDESI